MTRARPRRRQGGATTDNAAHSPDRRAGAASASRFAGLARAIACRLDTLPPGRSATLVAVLLLLVYPSTASRTWQQSPDPLAALIPAWQLVNHGTLALDEYAGLLPWFKEFDGRVVSDRAPGVVLFGVPFYWLFQGGGQSPVPAAIAACVAAAGAMAVLYLVLRRHVRPATATAAALLAGLGTATWTVSADGLWPHGPAQLWLALALLAAPRRPWASGLFFGLAILTRPQAAVAAAAFGLFLAVQGRSARPLAQIGAGAVLGVLGLVAYNTVAFGAPSLTGGYEDLPMRNLSALTVGSYGLAVVGTLVSPDRGLLVLSPFLAVLACGIPAVWRRCPPEVRAGGVAGVAYLAVYLMVNRFSGGENFFSYRLPLESLTLAAPLLVISFDRWVRHRPWATAAFWPLAASAVAVHALGAVHYAPEYVAHGPWRGARLAQVVGQAGPWWASGAGALVACAAVVGGLRARRARAAERAAVHAPGTGGAGVP